MIAHLHALPIVERIKLVEDLWDSIAVDQATIKVTDEQKDELDRRLDAYESDGNKGRLASESIAAIRKSL
ncbi:MAG: addiction module protein [Gammaproteobacteria bacterium]|nr:addiction module protein [Gammaproteobacteria bacterium]